MYWYSTTVLGEGEDRRNRRGETRSHGRGTGCLEFAAELEFEHIAHSKSSLAESANA